MIVPYLLIAGVWYGVKYIFIERDIGGFLYELSTFSFWLEHKGAWYVAMLIPVYLAYPFYYKWVEQGKRGVRTVLCCSGVVTMSLLLMRIDANLYVHLSSVLASLIWFMVGHYIGKPIKEKCFNDRLFVIIIALIVLLKAMPVISTWKLIITYTYGAVSVVAAYCLVAVIEFGADIFYPIKLIQRCLSILGKVSLELYLTNIFLLQGYEYFGVRGWLRGQYGESFISMVLPQIIVLLLGIVLSFMFSRTANWFCSKFVRRKVSIS